MGGCIGRKLCEICVQLRARYGKKSVFQEPKANGADIAADPTLTVAWSSCPANLSRSAWHSVSIPPNGLEVLFTDARVGIRSRLSTQSYLSVPKPFQAVLRLPTLPRPFPLRDRFPQTAGFCLSFHLPRSTTRFLAYPVNVLRVLLRQLHLLPVCTFCIPSLKDRVDNIHCVGFLRNSREINSLEPDFRLGFSPFRCLETAPSK